jgi:Fe-S-cluster-containing dehydrogenase component
MTELPCGVTGECCLTSCPYEAIRRNNKPEHLYPIDRCYKWHKRGKHGEDPVRRYRGPYREGMAAQRDIDTVTAILKKLGLKYGEEEIEKQCETRCEAFMQELREKEQSQ